MKDENKNSAGVLGAVTAGVVILYLLSPGLVLVYYKRIHEIPGPWFDKVFSPIITLIVNNKTVESIYMAYLNALGVR